jgi:hypothetical protein
MPPRNRIDTGKRVRDGKSREWLSLDGRFVSDPALASVFPTCREALNAARSVSSKKLEVVMKVQQEYLVLQVLTPV